MDHSFRLRSDSCQEERIRGSRQTEPACLAPLSGKPRQNRWTGSISACSAAIRRSASLAVRLSQAVLGLRAYLPPILFSVWWSAAGHFRTGRHCRESVGPSTWGRWPFGRLRCQLSGHGISEPRPAHQSLTLFASFGKGFCFCLDFSDPAGDPISQRNGLFHSTALHGEPPFFPAGITGKRQPCSIDETNLVPPGVSFWIEPARRRHPDRSDGARDANPSQERRGLKRVSSFAPFTSRLTRQEEGPGRYTRPCCLPSGSLKSPGTSDIKTSCRREQMAMPPVMSPCRAAARHTFD